MTKNYSIFHKALFTAFTVLMGTAVYGQTLVSGQLNSGRIPTPTMLFMNVAPDARSAAMGDAGVAISSDVNAIYWNPAKIASSDKNGGFSFSYTPWLRNLVNDMALYNASAFVKGKGNYTWGGSINYFDQGLFQATLQNGTSAGNFNSKEYALTFSISRHFGNGFYLGTNIKYINSNLLGNYQGTSGSGVAMKPAQTVAADIGLYYTTNPNKDLKVNWGATISNISGKVSYGGAEKNFIPTNLRLGGAAVKEIENNKLTVTIDFNKLLVPTPQSIDANGNKVGTDPSTTSAIGGMFGSLFDAPDGFGEELKEFTTSLGAEYSFDEKFMLRGGYFNESEMKGNRKYFTLGVGFRIDQKYGFDFAYLVPTGTSSPLANTLRVTVLAGINQKR